MTVSEQNLRNLGYASQARNPSWTNFTAVRFPTLPPGDSGDMIAATLPSEQGRSTRVVIELGLREDPSVYSALASLLSYDGATTYRVTIESNNYDQVGTTDIATTATALAAVISAGTTGVGTETCKGTTKHTIGTFDAATTYTVTVDGRDYDQLGTTDEQTTMDLLAAQINTGWEGTHVLATVDASDNLVLNNLTADTYDVAVSVSGGTGTLTFVVIDATAVKDANDDIAITSTGSADITVTVATVAGTGDMDLTKDATDVDWALWALATGQTTPKIVASGSTVTQSMVELIQVGWADYLALQITDTDGNVSRAIGLCDLPA